MYIDLAVVNCKIALALLTDAFGATLIESRFNGKHDTFAIAKLGDVYFRVIEECEHVHLSTPDEECLGITLNIFVDDVERAFREALKLRCYILIPNNQKIGNHRYTAILDPDGYTWVIHQNDGSVADNFLPIDQLLEVREAVTESVRLRSGLL